MDLTPEAKRKIDEMSHYQLLEAIRFLPVGDPLMAGASGDYLLIRLVKLRNEPGGAARHIAVSKELGWERGAR
jgi:hypothetical protein